MPYQREELLLKLGKMTDSLKHRGPDDEGQYLSEKPCVGLGHRRLSIIDLTLNAHQPMSNEDSTMWIVQNGEIYNYKELTQDLKSMGHIFKSNSDTEAIIHAYEEYGVDCLYKLNGMFSFALWDSRRNRLFIARDRMGIKPLIYGENSKLFLFGSEIRSIFNFNDEIKKDLDFKGFNYYLTFGFIPAPFTIYKGIKKLLPGHYMIIKNGEVTIKKYWDIDYSKEEKGSENYFEDRLEYLLRESVRKRMVSDAPLGAFLSGGIDSSSVVGLMSELFDQPVKTFSIGFEDQSYSELKYARIVAEKCNTDHHEYILKPDPIALFEDMVNSIDEPFADTSSIPTYLVSKIAREDVKVVLSGDGGDELFAGYDWYLADILAHNLSKIRLNDFDVFKVSNFLIRFLPTSRSKKGGFNSIKKFIEGGVLPGDMRNMRWHVFFSEEDKKKLLKRDLLHEMEKLEEPSSFINDYINSCTAKKRLRQDMLLDAKMYLPDNILTKVDRMSMANSLECRVPLLDHELVEFVTAIPDVLKRNKIKSKIIFKNSMKNILPFEIYNRRDKRGFSVPMKNWLNNELKELAAYYLFQANESSFFDREYLRRVYRDHKNLFTDNNAKIRSILIFSMWHKEKFALFN